MNSFMPIFVLRCGKITCPLGQLVPSIGLLYLVRHVSVCGGTLVRVRRHRGGTKDDDFQPFPNGFG